MKRRGGVGATVAGVVTIIIVVAFGAVIIEGNSEGGSQSKGKSGGEIGSSLSNGLGMLESGLRFAGGGGLGQVQTEGIVMMSDTFTGSAPVQPTCSTSPINSFIQLTNKGSGNGAATGVTITYGGSNNAFSIAGPCQIGPSGSATATTYILFKGPSELPNSSAPEPGEPFVGSVALSDGAHLPFTGMFSSGYPIVRATSVSLRAASFSKGPPTNSTCAFAPVPGYSFIMLNNTGTVGDGVMDLTISSGNSTSTVPIAGVCGIGASGTPDDISYVLFGPKSQLSFTAVPGLPFNGTVWMNSKLQVRFSGIFG
jgi:hypothetical protein